MDNPFKIGDKIRVLRDFIDRIDTSNTVLKGDIGVVTHTIGGLCTVIVPSRKTRWNNCAGWGMGCDDIEFIAHTDTPGYKVNIVYNKDVFKVVDCGSRLDADMAFGMAVLEDPDRVEMIFNGVVQEVKFTKRKLNVL